MARESTNLPGIGPYFSRGAHLPQYILDMLEPYIPHRIEMPKDEIAKRIAERVAHHQSKGETTQLSGGLIEYRTSVRPFVAALTDFNRDFRLYHFPYELAGKHPNNKMPLEFGEGVTIIDGVLRIVTIPPKGGLPISHQIPDGFIHSRESTHMRIIGLGTLHDLGIK